MVTLTLKCGLEFPFINKAVQILQSILPETELTPEEELLFVLRAYGKAITGQNIQIETVLQNEDFSFEAILDKGNSMALKDKFSRKLVAVKQFNKWLIKQGFLIEVKPNLKYLE
ncbi:MAG: hypothetical protein ACTSRL_03845 [Candidatus Helarchaeota archaeon]